MKFTLITLLASTLVSGHSMMYKPSIRGSIAPWWGTCGAQEGCMGPCEATFSQTDYAYRQRPAYKRGETIPVEWGRLNHPGGFVRLAIVPTKNSESQAAFDENVVKTTCFEKNCQEDVASSFHGYMNGPNDLGSPTAKKICSSTLTIPSHLPDGEYTLQFIWHSGGVNTGNRYAPFGNFYSCSDFFVKGGEVGERPPASFEGGDAVVKNNKECRYWGKPDVKSCAIGYDASNPEKCPQGDSKVGVPSTFQPPTNNPKPSDPASPNPSAPESPISNPSPSAPATPKPSDPSVPSYPVNIGECTRNPIRTQPKNETEVVQKEQPQVPSQEKANEDKTFIEPKEWTDSSGKGPNLGPNFKWSPKKY